MKINAVAVAYQRRFNLGDYQSLGLECTIWADLEEGDEPDQVIATLQEQARIAVKREHSRIPAKQNGKPTH